jgi:uncharacterized membrane protein YhiD involved in acid resistance
MDKFQVYLNDFSNTVNIWDFIINLLVAAILSIIIKVFYIRFATSFSNREKFSSIFLPLALSTLLIITVVKASIALSLGLVGALSIVRFRAAIKEPEELTYLFLVIGVGLTAGANKPILAITAILLILPLLYLNTRMSNKKVFTKDKLLINIRSKSSEVNQITESLSQSLSYIELKRLEDNAQGIVMTFVTKVDNINSINTIRDQLKSIDPDIHVTFLDQPEISL